MLQCEESEAFVYRVIETAPQKNNRALAVYLHGTHFLWTVSKSGNGPLGLEIVKYTKMPQMLLPHPTNGNVALARFRDDGLCKLFVTENFGRSWHVAAEGRRASWVKRADSLIEFMHLDACDEVATASSTLWESAAKQTHTTFAPQFTDLYAVDWTGYVTSTDNHEQVFLGLTDDQTLMVSRNARQWVHAFLPVERKERRPTEFTVYGVDDGAIIVTGRAQNGERAPTVGDLYVSGNATALFSLSLANQAHSGGWSGFSGYGDFEKLQSIDGVFISNRYADESGAQLETLITYDLGGSWRRLPAPAGSQCADANKCFLNLFGLSTQHDTLEDYGGFGRFYSVPSAVGIMFGTGNTGEYLDTTGDVHTYFSRDAGVTWEKVIDGRYAYEIADHGALLALVARDEPSAALRYTWDEGLKWRGCNFTAAPFAITNLITETQFSSQTFLVYGHRTTAQGNDVAVLVSVDLASVHERECVADDYEDFLVPIDQGCILGMKTTYVRRKREKKCYNPNTHPVNKRAYTRCECTRDDFECAPCHVASLEGGECERDPTCTEPTKDEMCEIYCYYWPADKPQKYFRVAGDQCVGNSEAYEDLADASVCPRPECGSLADHLPVSTPAHVANHSSPPTALIVVGIVVLLLALCIAFVCVTGKPAALYERLRPNAGANNKYSKLNFDTGDTTSFFEDDETSARF